MRFAIVCFSTLILLLHSGCAQFEQGQRFDQAQADRIRIGQTTKQEVEDLLGPPHSSMMMPMTGYMMGPQMAAAVPEQGDIEMWSYSYSRAQGQVTSPFTGTAGGAGATLQITFKKGIVADCTIMNTTNSAQIMMVPYFTSGRSAGGSHQRRCGSG